jgi:hexosaminidase
LRINIFRVLVALLGIAAASGEPNLMPWPYLLVPGDGAMAIDAGLGFDTKGCGDDRVSLAVARLTARLSRQTGLIFFGGKSAMALSCGSGQEDEAYKLDVSSHGAKLTAQSPLGILHGLETFAQLVAPGKAGFEVPALHIQDQPRFAWRGLMIDASRHWMPAPVIERNLDAMAAVKMNVFHWHLTDDQGFRVESKKFPRLQEFGSDGHFYTQIEIRHILEYAHERGILVVPEFDMPGHTTSWFAGMPELATAPGPYQIERSWGIFAPAMDPTHEDVYQFLDGFLGEMASLFTDPYFHIGGDEVEGTQWKNSPQVQEFCRAHGIRDSVELHAYFNRRVAALVKKHGKIMIGWDEVLASGLSTDTVIQSWRGQESLAAAASKDYRGILSFGYYLDHLQPASFHYANDPGKDPHILGGEACIWTEYVNSETVDSRIWPRAAAIAERLWSPNSVKDTDSMYRRLDAVSGVLDQVGVHHRSYEDPTLSIIAGGRPADALRVLADAVEALGIEGRRDVRHYTSLIPLNRLVDAAHPESAQIRHLEQAAVEGRYAELEPAFAQWAANRALVERLAVDDFLVRELLPLADNLSATGSIGLLALKYLEQDQAVPEGWVAEQRKTLAAMNTSKLEVTLAAVRPVRSLLERLERKSARSAKP